jgi:hypothetical protein
VFFGWHKADDRFAHLRSNSTTTSSRKTFQLQPTTPEGAERRRTNNHRAKTSQMVAIGIACDAGAAAISTPGRAADRRDG